MSGGFGGITSGLGRDCTSFLRFFEVGAVTVVMDDVAALFVVEREIALEFGR